ncbi:cation-translocating P-type ATPase [Dictyobacter formicarum]|uniref:Cation transporter E1-E2 family ATPase n=1 Tax=Dictyobacter formicarum TaxID=2778368 RepID=A0ABQ3VQH5_9CHLR|nr:cation-translocating P-type ATPase [Dictyobacter formicarum]GHO88514.1 cation transporter E1-E2 family ATPase [Dictyobacter formicarum]
MQREQKPMMNIQEQRPRIQGLSTREVEERRARGLGCVPPPATGRSYLRIVRENVLNTVNTILFSIALALVVLGQYLDALISVGVISFNMIISLIQEVRAKRTLDRIALLTRPKALVLRDGREQLIEPEALVVGDILVMRPGDQIIVDGPLVGDGCVEVDESLLTGEADPMTKREGDKLYSGTFCVTGRAYYRAEHVGIQSVAGTLTVRARAYRATFTPLQREIALIIRTLLFVAIFLEILLAAAATISVIPIVETVRMAMVIIGIVPNGLFLSISVAYALGAVRIAGKGTLVQKFNAIESLSHVDVLCTDKTGTLTTNTLELAALHPYGIDEARLRLLLGSYCAHLSNQNATSTAIGAACCEQALHELSVWQEIPFSSARKWGALRMADTAMEGTYVLGAPDTLQPYLTTDADLGTFLETETKQGRRVLLFVHADEPMCQQAYKGEAYLPSDLRPLGAISLRDKLRPEARETLEQFATLGIQIKIISGDHPQTVARIAQQLGLEDKASPLSGAELDVLDDAQLAQRVEETMIFGRITPQQKERIVQALHRRNHYVAMIGDGVNDVLALKQAKLGIAMQSGSQATRGVADLILLHDTFASLPSAVHEGQRIRNGMQDILKLFLARVASVTLLLISITFIGGIPFQPRQTSLLTFFTVAVPTLALAYWARPERIPNESIIRSLVRFVLPVSITMCLIAIGVYLSVLIPAALTSPVPTNPYREGPLPLAQTAMTIFLVFCGFLLVLFVEPPNRARPGQKGPYSNWLPTLMVLMLLICFIGVLSISSLRTLFNLQALSLVAYLLISAATLLWAVLMWIIWRFHLFERLFGNTEE